MSSELLILLRWLAGGRLVCSKSCLAMCSLRTTPVAVTVLVINQPGVVWLWQYLLLSSLCCLHPAGMVSSSAWVLMPTAHWICSRRYSL